MSTSSIFPKRILAAILLGLFAFILAEKTLHEHEAVAKTEIKGETVIEPAKTCAICDFKLSADADIPDDPGTTVVVFSVQFINNYFTYFLLATPSCLSERGPPASFYAFL